MRHAGTFDSLLVFVRQRAIESLTRYVEAQLTATVRSVSAVGALLRVGLPGSKGAIRAHLDWLDNWAEWLGDETGLVDESSTGLLGMWLSLCPLRGWVPDNRLVALFLDSVERNLQKQSDLSLGTSLELLVAVAKGSAAISASSALRTSVGDRLKALLVGARPVEAVQALEAWRSLGGMENSLQLELRHAFEKVAADDSAPMHEKAMAFYGLMQLGMPSGAQRLDYEMHFLECIALAAGDDMSSQLLDEYTLCLPCLTERLSYDHLFQAWQRYGDTELKRAKVENYCERLLLGLGVAAVPAVVFWPWYRGLQPGFQVSIGAAAVTVVLMAITLTVEAIVALSGREFWGKGRVELTVALLGAIVTVAAAVLEAMSK